MQKTDIIFDDSHFMRQAIEEAQQALQEDEIPIGCVVVCQNRIVGRGHNQTQHLNDATAHAELIALSAAENNLGSKYLPHCTLYVTLEPCIMCAGAIGWTHVGKLVYGASDTKKGFTLFQPTPLHPKTVIVAGILAESCRQLLLDFFNAHRYDLGR